jgi:hypothetical protein
MFYGFAQQNSGLADQKVKLGRLKTSFSTLNGRKDFRREENDYSPGNAHQPLYALAGVVAGEGHAHLQNAVDTKHSADNLDNAGYKAAQVVEHSVDLGNAGGQGPKGEGLRARRLRRDNGTAHKDHYGGEYRQEFPQSPKK